MDTITQEQHDKELINAEIFERFRFSILEMKMKSKGKTKPFITVVKTVKGDVFHIYMSHFIDKKTNEAYKIYSTENEQEAIGFKHMVNSILL
jgi:hypothetical protein